MVDTLAELDIRHHDAGTMVTIEGPRFSTRAESHMFRSWGADLINMTTCPEATLAKEAGLLYAAFAMSTGGDCLNLLCSCCSTTNPPRTLPHRFKTHRPLMHPPSRAPSRRINF